MANEIGGSIMFQHKGLTESELGRSQQLLDRIVGFQAFAALGALVAAIAPAVMATTDGTTLRGSVSAYYDVDPEHYFWAPFTAAGVLLLADGAASYLSANKNRFGRRWYNVVLGVALLLLTWFNLDDAPTVHFPAASVFFGLFIAVITYTAALGIWSRSVPGARPESATERLVDRVFAEVSLVFLLLLVLTLAAWGLGLISFFFFEVFALVNFALFYVQGLVRPFPYNEHEFRSDAVNRFFRGLRIMATA
ncbi:MAG: DUF7103 family protein [Acidimicrobiales bacterium]